MSPSPAFVFDLETCLMKKGYKREETVILSIAAIDLYSDRHFNIFVKPTGVQTKEELLLSLKEQGARLDSSECVLNNIRYDVKRAIDLPVALELFKSFLEFERSSVPILLAHNGNAFDFRILNGSLSKSEIELTYTGLDTYTKLAKKVVRLESYKLGNMYRSIVPKLERRKLKFHNALDDCIALKQVVFSCLKRHALKHVEAYFKHVYVAINRVHDVNLKLALLGEEEQVMLRAALKKLKFENSIIINKMMEVGLGYFI